MGTVYKDVVTQAINDKVFSLGTPLEEFFAFYEKWAMEISQKRYPTIEAAAKAMGLTRRQYVYRLRKHGLLTGDEFPVDAEEVVGDGTGKVEE